MVLIRSLVRPPGLGLAEYFFIREKNTRPHLGVWNKVLPGDNTPYKFSHNPEISSTFDCPPALCSSFRRASATSLIWLNAQNNEIWLCLRRVEFTIPGPPGVEARPHQKPTNGPREPTKYYRWCPVVVERPSCALEKQ
jgi:hypothetical protein